MSRKTQLAIALGYLFLAALPAFAIKYNLLAPIKDLQTVSGGNIYGDYMSKFIPFVLAFAAIAAVVQVVVGGLEYALSEAITSKQEAKDRIESALSGLLLALVSYLILNAINPNLTTLQLAVPPVNAPISSGSATNAPGCGLYQGAPPEQPGFEFIVSSNSCANANTGGGTLTCYCRRPAAGTKKCCYERRSVPGGGFQSCYDASNVVEVNATENCPAGNVYSITEPGETCQQAITAEMEENTIKSCLIP